MRKINRQKETKKLQFTGKKTSGAATEDVLGKSCS